MKQEKGGILSKDLKKKGLVVIAVIAAALAIKLAGLDQYLTLGALKHYRDALQQFYDLHRALVIAVYFLSYIGVAALSIPGAAVMTLAGGALFGLLTGTVIVSFASSIGATLAFLASRFLFRDWVQERFEDRLVKVNWGISKEGPLYLFTLRLVPVFPFFAINLLMGLTAMPARTFYLVSQLGMLPGTVVYVNAGRELARIDSISDIMSARLITAFVLLGILPLAAKWIVSILRSKTREKSS